MYKPIYEITPRLLSLITQATELCVWIRQSAVKVTWLQSLQRDTAARLAHSSTAIEGNPLSLEQARSLAEGRSVSAKDHSKKEILDYLKALKWIEKEKVNGSLTEKRLLILHRLITQNTLDKKASGTYKTKPNRIVDAKGRTVYVPPKPMEVKKLTRELLVWMNQPATMKLHPVIVSAVAHHRLVSIHPFIDGNGRVSRALAIWILYTRKFDTHHLFAVDEYFELNRTAYYQKIQQARDLDGDLTYWLEYTAAAIVETLEKTKERIRSLQLGTKNDRILLTERQEEVLRFIRERGRVRSSDIGKHFQLTRSRVNQLVKPLVDAAILIRAGETRATTYTLA